MFTVIKNSEIYAPDNIGKKDVLLAAGKIALIDDAIEMPKNISTKIIDGTGKYIFPGFIDTHVHITGGGGEGGFKTRTPEVMLSQLTTAGVTTVIGTLGTDGTTRTITNLLAKANGLSEEGITCFVNVGAYQVPVKTLTERIMDDLILIEKILGVGEIAISDHRSSAPTFDEISKICAAVRVGGMLSGKAGIINFHLGDGKTMIDIIERIILETDIPIKHFFPTHMNRNQELFERSISFAMRGGFVDYTTSTTQVFLDEGEVKCSKALKLALVGGVSQSNISFSSDAQGSLPSFDAQGKMVGIEVGSAHSLYKEVVDSIKIEGLPIEVAIKVITTNPALVYKLKTKGEVKVGFDADLVMVDKDTLEIQNVIALGQIMVMDKNVLVKGTFE